ncbi:MAG: HNH endonuclease [Candidatus Omnitrophica bacterium]|nr:HNH endonuclease [Candidatus Omnitrophota bacterium]
MHYIAVIIIAGVVYWLSEKAANLIRGYFAERAEEEARIDKENEIREFNEKTREQHLYVKKKYKNLNPEEIAVSKEIENERIPIEIDPDIYFENGNLIDELGIEYMTGEGIKQLLLTELHGYDYEEAEELIKTAQRAERREKLKSVKRKIKQKTQEEYGNIPSDSREPIPEEVKNQVWNRDGGKCVKCGSKEKLEFDHIIPISKGGANTARNIQLLCERCNREKSNNIG